MNMDLLTQRYWRYGLVGSAPVCNALRFNPNGRISGYYSKNEHRWEIENSNLIIYDVYGNKSVFFDDIKSKLKDDGVEILGWYKDDVEPKISMAPQLPTFQPRVFSQLRDSMMHLVSDHGYEVGDYSYGLVNAVDPQFGKMKIGKFCSIGPNFTAIIGNHDWRLVTSYPFIQIDKVFNNIEEQWDLSEISDKEDHYSNGTTEIGNDVWVGKDVIVISGIKIGDGAVIAAGAVVTKDVPAYSIVGGNPAKLIRYRFSPEIINRLLNLRWWDWEKEKLSHFLPLLVSHDIEKFLDAAESLEGELNTQINSAHHPL